jgi:hypothetical protein
MIKGQILPEQRSGMTESGPFGLDPGLANDHLWCRKVLCRHGDILALNEQFIEFSEKKWFSRPLL